jgi:arylsulfatase A-like enzyme
MRCNFCQQRVERRSNPEDLRRTKTLRAMKYPVSLLIALLLVSQAARASEARTQGAKPNILVILSDDQGYSDVGFQGCTDIPTPNLDRLAREGVRCTSGHVSHPYCSPSRAGLLTGRYQARFGHEHNPRYLPDNHQEGLPLTEKILPEFLRQAGYSTGWIGKWHLGGAPEFHAENRGFQETFGFLSGVHHYLNWKPNEAKEAYLPIERNGKAVEVTEHLTLAFGHEAVAFIHRHKNEPWVRYLAFNAPHDPAEPTPERLQRFKNITDKRRRGYAAQVSLLDDAIGETLAALNETGQERNTLVFFFSDNGAPVTTANGGSGPNGGINAPLRDGKHSVYEGGVRVPFVVRWPDRLPGGKDYGKPVSSLDVFATALACAGMPMPTDRPYDGVDLVPYLRGEKSGAPHDRLFWRLNERFQAAALEGNNKLVRDGAKPDQLFDLSADLGESTNLAGNHPETLAALHAALAAWFHAMATKLAFPGNEGPEREWPEPQETNP